MDRQQEAISTTTTTIDILNDDCLLRIFDYLHFDDKIRLRRASSRWRRLLEWQLDKTRALRIGHFLQGGYSVTSGLLMGQCGHQSRFHRQHTGTLFNQQLLGHPADLETQCYSVTHYDYLHRALKYCYQSITQLSLGRLHVSYRLLMVLTHNLPCLEHLELIGCASGLEQSQRRQINMANNPSGAAQLLKLEEAPPSLEAFNNRNHAGQGAALYHSTMSLFNQHLDEQVNMEQRLLRSRLVRDCQLVRDARSKNHWPKLQHLLVKECNLLNEFSLSLIVALTSQSLTQMTIESNQYLTGEFLNYCGPQLKILKLKYCPLLQPRFLEELMKLRQLLNQQSESNANTTTTTHTNSTTKPALAHLSSSLIATTNFSQGIDCIL